MAQSRIQLKGKGFLTEDLSSRLYALPGVNRKLAEVVVDLARYAIKLVATLPVDGASYDTAEEKQRIIVLVLVVRLLEIVESTLILAASGVRQELNTMLRVFLDAYFLIANTCSDPGFLSVYMRTDVPERLKLLKAASKYNDDPFRTLNEYATADVKSALDQKIRAERIQAFNSYVYAEKVGCAQFYDLIYRVCSASIHTTPRCLEQYLETDGKTTILAVVHAGDTETTNRVLYDMGSFFGKALCGVCELFCHDQAEVRRFEEALEKAAHDNAAP